MGKYEDLEKLQKLKESGALSEQEFESEKQKVLNETDITNEDKSKENEEKAKKYTEETQKEKKTTNKKTLKIYGLIFVIAIIICMAPAAIVTINSNSKKSEEEKTEDTGLTQNEITEEQKEEEERKKEQEEVQKNGYYKSSASNETIILCAKTLINNTLRSSYTAIWGDSELVDQDNYGRCLVYVSLEAQNGFGAYQKLNYFVILQEVERDGNFRYLPYTCLYEITSYLENPYKYVTDYKEGNIMPVIQTFLDNNNWNQRKDSETTNEDVSDSDENVEDESQTSRISIGEEYNCITSGAVGFIRFDSNKNFTMNLENGDIENFIRTGTYVVKEDTIILTVTYDSSDLNNTFYTEEITIDEDGNLKYITEYDNTIIFAK